MAITTTTTTSIDHRHDSRVRSYSLVHDGPVPFSAIEMFLDLLRSAHGDKLLRMKGVIELAEDPSRPLVIHGVQKILHPPARLPSWPDGQRGTRLVLITLDMPEDYVRRLFAAFTNRPSIDTPDRAALENNPLAIAGRFEPAYAIACYAPRSTRKRWPPVTAAVSTS